MPPHVLKLEPRWGVPKNKMALVCSAMLANVGFALAWMSA